MKQKLLFVALILQSSLVLSQVKMDISRDSIIGKWYSMSGNDTVLEIEFCNNGMIKKKNYSLPFDMSEGYFSDYYKKWIDYEIFKVEKEGEQLFLNIYSQDNDLLEKKMLFYLGNELVCVSTKWWIEDICLHIDEILIFEKANAISRKRSSVGSSKIVKYYLPQKLIGMFYIVYNQEKGEKQEYDIDSNRIYKIPDSGILFTKFKADPLAVGLNTQKFFWSDGSLKTKDKIGDISYIEHMDTSLLSTLNFRDEQLVVISHGFNQQSRASLNEILGEDIHGNVEFLEIIPFKEIKKRGNNKGYL